MPGIVLIESQKQFVFAEGQFIVSGGQFTVLQPIVPGHVLVGQLFVQSIVKIESHGFDRFPPCTRFIC